MKTATLAEIEAIPKNMLTARDIAPFLGCDPQDVRNQARRDANKNTNGLGYPVTIYGSAIRIPKEGFINWVKGVNKA